MINDIQKILISFAAGLGLGVFGGKVYYEKKYQMKLKGETFNSDKETKSEEVKPEETKLEEVKQDEAKPEEKDPKESSELNKNKDDLNSMVKKVQEENARVDYSTPTPGEKKHEVDPVVAEDFVLEPDDFGELADEEYETVTILSLADGNFAYENGKVFDPVEQPEKKIGNEALQVLKNTSNDVVYVRNNRTKIDYEIIKDDRTLNEGMSVEDDDFED